MVDYIECKKMIVWAVVRFCLELKAQPPFDTFYIGCKYAFKSTNEKRGGYESKNHNESYLYYALSLPHISYVDAGLSACRFFHKNFLCCN